MTDRTESNVPKKSPLSLQMDLSKFTLATEEEKAQQEVYQLVKAFLGAE